MLPKDLGEHAAFWTRDFENPLVARRVSLANMARFFVNRRRAQNDFPIRESERPLFRERNNVTLKRIFASVRFVDKQNPRGVSAKVTRRFRGDNFERAALEPPRKNRTAKRHHARNRTPALPGTRRVDKHAMKRRARLKKRLDIRNNVVLRVRFRGKQNQNRRRILRTPVADRRREQRGKTDARRLNQRHPFNRRISNRIRQAALIGE
jgi:hypothetical protein